MKSHLAVSHLAFEFCFWNQCGYGVHYYYIHCSGENESVGDLEGLFTIVWLRYQQIIDIYTQFSGIGTVEGVFRIDDGADPAFLLGFGDHMCGQGGLTRAFRSVYFNDAAFRQSSDPQCHVEAKGTGRNDFLLLLPLFIHHHHTTLSEILVDLVQCEFECLEFFAV